MLVIKSISPACNRFSIAEGSHICSPQTKQVIRSGIYQVNQLPIQIINNLKTQQTSKKTEKIQPYT